MQCSDTDTPCPNILPDNSPFDDPTDWSAPEAAVTIKRAAMRLHVPAVRNLPKPRRIVRLKAVRD